MLETQNYRDSIEELQQKMKSCKVQLRAVRKCAEGVNSLYAPCSEIENAQSMLSAAYTSYANGLEVSIEACKLDIKKFKKALRLVDELAKIEGSEA